MILIRYDYSASYPDGEGADKDEEVFRICLHSILNLTYSFFYLR